MGSQWGRGTWPSKLCGCASSSHRTLFDMYRFRPILFSVWAFMCAVLVARSYMRSVIPPTLAERPPSAGMREHVDSPWHASQRFCSFVTGSDEDMQSFGNFWQSADPRRGVFLSPKIGSASSQNHKKRHSKSFQNDVKSIQNEALELFYEHLGLK